MDELVDIMRELLFEIKEMNAKLDDIRGMGINSIDDVCNKLDDIRGLGVNSMDDVYNELVDIQHELDSVKGLGIYNSISDVCDKLDSLELTVTLGENY